MLSQFSTLPDTNQPHSRTEFKTAVSLVLAAVPF